MKTRHLPIELEVKGVFRTSKGAVTKKTNHFILLDERYAGECSGSIIYGPKEDEISHDLDKGLNILGTMKNVSGSTLEEINALDINPVTKAGILTAVLHKISGDGNQYPWRVLSVEPPGKIRTSFTVSIDDPIHTREQITSSPYPFIKLKMGSDHDDEIISMLKQISGKIFRIDVNGAWDLARAEKMIYELSRINVEIVEQPTGPEFMHEWPHIKGRSKACLMVDEGLFTIDDYGRFCDYVDGVNIKMAKSGGVIEAAKIARRAKKDKKKVMFGCMVESSIAIAQSVYLAALGDLFDLDGPLLLKNDTADGVTYNNEAINVDESIIGGPKMKKEYAAKN